MEVKAVGKYVRVQPRKVRIIADEVRGKNAAHVASLLRYHTSKGAKMLRKVLISAMANAQENNNLPVDHLVISQIMVDEGPRLKRMQARAMGRGNRIVKKTSHITVIVEDQEPKAAVKPHGTKAKVRPTLATGKGKKAQGSTIGTTTQAKVTTPAEEPTNEIVEEATPVTAAEAPEEAGSTQAEATTDSTETTTAADETSDPEEEGSADDQKENS